ncbi:hypothetical protein BBP40_001077 [Aspergillus hancockii]|nr:hypothetical protein BBP40_001077 [Aspergillus hancockii]
MDDTDSINTAGPDIQPSKKEAYISAFADDLLDKDLTEKPDGGSLGSIYEALPGLLKTFAMKVGSSDPMQIYRDVMVFVRKHRSEIDRSMRVNYIEENSIRSGILGNNRDRISHVGYWFLDIDNLADLYTASNETLDDIMDDDHFQGLEEANRATDSLPELPADKQFISEFSAYKWMLERIQKVLYFVVPGKSQANIRDASYSIYPGPRKSAEGKRQRHNLALTVEWDPCLFLQQQGYLESLEKTYLTQTWPSSGIHLLHVVKHVAQDDVSSIPYFHVLPDGTQLITWSRGPEFKHKAISIAESIAEIREQLAWLASAVRSSPYETGDTVINAFVGGMWTDSSSELTGGFASTFVCNISFNLDVIDDSGELSNGQCWLQLF